jgi:prevent-host-death family protein
MQAIGNQGSQNMSDTPMRKGAGVQTAHSEIVSMSSTEAQNGFGHVLELVARDCTVFITRRNTARAVVMSVERYQELTREIEPDLDDLTAEFDALLERLQTPQARTGLREALRASPDELAEAALAAARAEHR